MHRTGRIMAAVTLATGAAVAGLAAGGPAFATQQNGLVNVYTEDVLSHNQVVILQNVPISTAANVCGLTTNVLSNELASSNKAQCTAKSNNLVKSWVVYS